MINECYREQSRGHALFIADVSGYVRIFRSFFLQNEEFNNHGTAIYCSTKTDHHLQSNFTIDNCSFRNNTGDSIVYLEGQKRDGHILLMNCKFTKNHGVPLYLTKLSNIQGGNLSFVSNTAENGGGIYITESTLHIHIKSYVEFKDNKAKSDGGAIFLGENNIILFKQNTN